MLSRLRFQRINITFPVTAIKRNPFGDRQRPRIDTSQIYAPCAGMAAGAVEGFYTARLAEHMHGLAGIKSIFCQLILTRQKP